MLIDILYLIVFVFAVIRGFKQGFIVGILSFIGIIAGLAAALKLSVVVAQWLEGSTNLSARWLPVLSFLLVFIGVMMLVRIGAAILEKIAEALFLGFFNKIGGILMFVFIHTVIFSILLFYTFQTGLFSEDTIAASVVYPWISPIGPWVIEKLGTIIPFFKDMFLELQKFFGQFAEEGTSHETVKMLL